MANDVTLLMVHTVVIASEEKKMFKKMSLAAKIGSGFGVVIVLLILIAAVSWNGLSGVAGGFVEYRSLARHSNLAGQLQANMLMVRMNVKDYINTASDKDIQEYQEYYDIMNGFLKEAHEEIQDPERAAVIDEYTNDVKLYDGYFDQVVELVKKRDQLVINVLDTTGPTMEKHLTEIMATAKQDNDAEAAYEAGIALRHMLLGRLYAQKFLDTNAKADEERVNAEFEKLFAEIEKLETMLQNPQRRALNAEVAGEAGQYMAAFTELADDIYTRNDIINNKLDMMGPEMAEDVEIVKLSVKEDQDTLGPIVQAQSRNAIRVALIAAGLAVLLGVAAAFVITRSITGPVRKVVEYVDYMAKGDFTAKIDIDQQDEIGRMSSALGKTVGELGVMIKEIVHGVNTLTSSSTELSAVSSQLSGNAEDASNRSNAVASAAEEMTTNLNSVSAAMEQSSSNVGMVATATEEMTSTVSEIAQSAAKAKGISEEAVLQSTQTSQKMNELGEAANRIGRVTETITEISEQTNLLALNATIEAARAGEAGKGFAVVANEIKDLAKQTADATVDIKNQIEDMQKTTDGTITDIETIGQVITEINDVINSIASAVEQQSAATSEIAENIAQASAGIGEVNENVAQSSVASGDITKEISEISSGSEEINEGSRNVKESATELSKLAEQLNHLVSRFKVA